MLNLCTFSCSILFNNYLFDVMCLSATSIQYCKLFFPKTIHRCVHPINKNILFVWWLHTIHKTFSVKINWGLIVPFWCRDANNILYRMSCAFCAMCISNNVTERFVRISCGRCFLRFINFFLCKRIFVEYLAGRFICCCIKKYENIFTTLSYLSHNLLAL